MIIRNYISVKMRSWQPGELPRIFTQCGAEPYPDSVIPTIGLARAVVPEGADPDAVLAALKNHPEIEDAEFDTEGKLCAVTNYHDYVSDPSIPTATLHRINVFHAAKLIKEEIGSYGSPTIKVGIIDSGYIADYQPGVGWVPAHAGLPTVSAANTYTAFGTTYQGVPDIRDPTSTTMQYGHGSNVAACIAGKRSYLSGVAPDVRLFIASCVSQYGGINDFNAADCITAAVNAGCHIINCSFSGTGYATQAAVTAAIAKGILVFGAAGNAGVEESASPGSTPGAISVGAINGYDDAPRYNYGARVDIVAPTFTHVADARHPGQYTQFSGTSNSTPLAVGVAALVWSISPPVRDGSGRQISGYTADYVKEILYLSAGKTVNATFATKYPGTHTINGTAVPVGVVDAARAVALARARAHPGTVLPYINFHGSAVTKASDALRVVNGYADINAFSTDPITNIELYVGDTKVYQTVSPPAAWPAFNFNAYPVGTPIRIVASTATATADFTYSDLITAQGKSLTVDNYFYPVSVAHEGLKWQIWGTLAAGDTLQIDLDRPGVVDVEYSGTTWKGTLKTGIGSLTVLITALPSGETTTVTYPMYGYFTADPTPLSADGSSLRVYGNCSGPTDAVRVSCFFLSPSQPKGSVGPVIRDDVTNTWECTISNIPPYDATIRADVVPVGGSGAWFSDIRSLPLTAPVFSIREAIPYLQGSGKFFLSGQWPRDFPFMFTESITWSGPGTRFDVDYGGIGLEDNEWSMGFEGYLPGRNTYTLTGRIWVSGSTYTTVTRTFEYIRTTIAASPIRERSVTVSGLRPWSATTANNVTITAPGATVGPVTYLPNDAYECVISNLPELQTTTITATVRHSPGKYFDSASVDVYTPYAGSSRRASRTTPYWDEGTARRSSTQTMRHVLHLTITEEQFNDITDVATHTVVLDAEDSTPARATTVAPVFAGRAYRSALANLEYGPVEDIYSSLAWAQAAYGHLFDAMDGSTSATAAYASMVAVQQGTDSVDSLLSGSSISGQNSKANETLQAVPEIAHDKSGTSSAQNTLTVASSPQATALREVLSDPINTLLTLTGLVVAKHGVGHGLDVVEVFAEAGTRAHATGSVSSIPAIEDAPSHQRHALGQTSIALTELDSPDAQMEVEATPDDLSIVSDSPLTTKHGLSSGDEGVGSLAETRAEKAAINSADVAALVSSQIDHMREMFAHISNLLTGTVGTETQFDAVSGPVSDPIVADSPVTTKHGASSGDSIIQDIIEAHTKMAANSAGVSVLEALSVLASEFAALAAATSAVLAVDESPTTSDHVSNSSLTASSTFDPVTVVDSSTTAVTAVLSIIDDIETQLAVLGDLASTIISADDAAGQKESAVDSQINSFFFDSTETVASRIVSLAEVLVAVDGARADLSVLAEIVEALATPDGAVGLKDAVADPADDLNVADDIRGIFSQSSPLTTLLSTFDSLQGEFSALCTAAADVWGTETASALKDSVSAPASELEATDTVVAVKTALQIIGDLIAVADAPASVADVAHQVVELLNIADTSRSVKEVLHQMSELLSLSITGTTALSITEVLHNVLTALDPPSATVDNLSTPGSTLSTSDSVIGAKALVQVLTDILGSVDQSSSVWHAVQAVTDFFAVVDGSSSVSDTQTLAIDIFNFIDGLTVISNSVGVSDVAIALAIIDSTESISDQFSAGSLITTMVDIGETISDFISGLPDSALVSDSPEAAVAAIRAISDIFSSSSHTEALSDQISSSSLTITGDGSSSSALRMLSDAINDVFASVDESIAGYGTTHNIVNLLTTIDQSEGLASAFGYIDDTINFIDGARSVGDMLCGATSEPFVAGAPTTIAAAVRAINDAISAQDPAAAYKELHNVGSATASVSDLTSALTSYNGVLLDLLATLDHSKSELKAIGVADLTALHVDSTSSIKHVISATLDHLLARDALDAKQGDSYATLAQTLIAFLDAANSVLEQSATVFEQYFAFDHSSTTKTVESSPSDLITVADPAFTALILPSSGSDVAVVTSSLLGRIGSYVNAFSIAFASQENAVGLVDLVSWPTASSLITLTTELGPEDYQAAVRSTALGIPSIRGLVDYPATVQDTIVADPAAFARFSALVGPLSTAAADLHVNARFAAMGRAYTVTAVVGDPTTVKAQSSAALDSVFGMTAGVAALSTHSLATNDLVAQIRIDGLIDVSGTASVLTPVLSQDGLISTIHFVAVPTNVANALTLPFSVLRLGPRAHPNKPPKSLAGSAELLRKLELSGTATVYDPAPRPVIGDASEDSE